MEKARQAMVQLKKNEISHDQAFETMCKEFAEKVGSTRVSIWSFNQLGDSIYCHKLYDERNGKFIQGFSLNEDDFPDYFKAVQSNLVVNAPDASKHPATKCFDELYFLPNDIHSLLDFIILKDGKPFGVLCCENCGAIKNWTAENVKYLESASALVSMTINSNLKRSAA